MLLAISSFCPKIKNETKNIVKHNGGIYVKVSDDEYKELEENTHVSMNMWGFYPGIIAKFNQQFKVFLEKYGQDNTKEFLLPVIVDRMLKNNIANIKVLETNDKWFGITYKEDKESVVSAIRNMIDSGEYPENLWK